MKAKIAELMAAAPKKRTTKLTKAKLLEARRRKGRIADPENAERRLTLQLVAAAHREARQWAENTEMYFYQRAGLR